MSRQRKRGEFIALGQGGVAAQFHDLDRACEIERRHRAEVGFDQHVAGLQVLLRLARATPHHDADHLVGDVERRAEVLAPGEREAHVDDDQPVDAHALCQFDRQVVDQPAVDEQPAVDLDRRQHAGRGHAGPQHGHEVALPEHERLARLEIRREGTERRRQAVEVLHVGDAGRGLAQRLVDLLALHEAERQHDAVPGTDAERTRREDVAVVLLATIGQVLARRAVADHALPVELAKHALDLLAVEACSVEPADHGAHAGAGDGVDRDMELLERADHADVRRATGAAAAQHEADARAFQGLGRPRARGIDPLAGGLGRARPARNGGQQGGAEQRVQDETGAREGRAVCHRCRGPGRAVGAMVANGTSTPTHPAVHSSINRGPACRCGPSARTRV